MAENQQPLPEEDQTPIETDLEPIVLTPEEAQAEIEEEEGEPAPADNRVFGLSRTCFHGLAFGVAIGYILCGFIGMILDRIGVDPTRAPSALVCAIVCAGIGFLIAKQAEKRRLAAREDEPHDQP